MGNGNVGDDLVLVGAWLTVMADFMAAIGATVSVEPPAEQSNSTSDQMQQQVDDLQIQIAMQKKQLQKQQIQMQLWQMHQDLKEIEQQIKKRKKYG